MSKSLSKMILNVSADRGKEDINSNFYGFYSILFISKEVENSNHAPRVMPGFRWYKINGR